MNLEAWTLQEAWVKSLQKAKIGQVYQRKLLRPGSLVQRDNQILCARVEAKLTL